MIAADSIAQRALRHDRLLVTCGLLFVVILAWTYLLTGAGPPQQMDGMAMPMGPVAWTAGHAAVMLVMWIVMMMAMMLPSAAPMILFFGSIARSRRARGEQPGGVGIFALGYVAVWSLFSLAAVALQFALERMALLSPAMAATSAALAGAVLMAAGIYQWTPLKQTCLSRCRSPLAFVLDYWREGNGGAFLMGLRHGAYCLGCCWMLMLLLFVGGVMNIAWIAGLAAFVLVEKLAPAGHWIGKLAGVLLAGWGLWTLLAVLR